MWRNVLFGRERSYCKSNLWQVPHNRLCDIENATLSKANDLFSKMFEILHVIQDETSIQLFNSLSMPVFSNRIERLKRPTRRLMDVTTNIL